MCAVFAIWTLLLAACGNGNTAQTADNVERVQQTGRILHIDIDAGQITIETMTASTAGTEGQPPEKPEGSTEMQQPPEKPEGSAEMQQPPEAPENGKAPNAGNGTVYTVTSQTGILDADGNSAALSALQEFSVVTFTADGDTLLAVAITADMQNGMAGPGGMEKMSGSGGTYSAPTEYAAENHYTEDASETSVTQMSVGTDECIAWVSNGAAVTLRGITADRTSVDRTGGDNASFYGIGAAYLVTDGTLNLSDSAVTTDSAGGAGVFAYGGGVANVADTVIITKQDTSGGIHVAGGGTLHAKNLTVETYGPSSAAIRSDRGSGTMTVDGGTYTSNGTGSPAVYSTADITVSNAVLLANGSEAVCIEGKNSLKLSNCDVTSSMPDNDQNDCKWSVILYQSVSGDAEIGSGSFEMSGGSLTSMAGGLFYTTNTSSSFTLRSVEIKTAGTPDFFLKCTGNSNKRGWGQAGGNGANCVFTAIGQQMTGDIFWDSISTLELNMTESSTLMGAIVDDESNAGDGGNGYANVTVDATSKWVVTGDSIVTVLNNSGTLIDAEGRTVSVVGLDGVVYVQGDSIYTVTVQTYHG